MVQAQKHGLHIRLKVKVPLRAPREHFHLFVRGPGGISDRQPRAVRVLGKKDGSLKFVVLSDHQFWDPSWKLQGRKRNSGAYPRRGQKEENKAITYQIIKEIELLDPDFVLYTGDFLFGLDYRKEYAEMWDWWHQNRMTTFMVPGNHDAYANYELRIRGNLYRIGKGLVACRKVFPRTRDWWKIWRYLVCVYRDIKNVLFDNLIHDGLQSWRRTFGPPFYSFEVGPYHFLALNTYDGSNKRRHAFALWVPFQGLKLGAPAVDNYGGYLSERQLRWIKKDLESAVKRGKTVVFFGHNDPRGNSKGQLFHHNEPFPTDPVGLKHFEEWNYDSKKWDSNPSDARTIESPKNHSGTELLRLVAAYGSYYFSGHVHEDEQTTFKKGETLLDGIKAKKRLTFVRVTTAASSVRKRGYWGYRLLYGNAKGQIDTRAFHKKENLLSIPAGNFWKDTWNEPEGPQFTLYNGLPRALEITLRYRLKYRPKTGYRFDITKGTPTTGSLSPRVTGVSRDRDKKLATYYVQTHLPSYDGPFPPRRHTEATLRIDTKVARKNRRPIPRITLLQKKGTESLPQQLDSDKTLELSIGAAVVLDASASTDPEKRPLGASYWTVTHRRSPRNDGHQRPREAKVLMRSRGKRVAFHLTHLGLYEASVQVYDSQGALGRKTVTILARPPETPPVPTRCGCGLSSGPTIWIGGAGLLVALIFFFISLILLRTRRNRSKQNGQPHSARRP